MSTNAQLQVSQAKKRATIVTAYQKIFSTPEGKKVLYDLMKNHHILTPIFGKGLSDKEIFAREGDRNVFLRILSMLKIDAKELYDRIEEYQHELDA